MVALIIVALVGPPSRTITKPIAMKVVFQTVSPARVAIESRRQSCGVAPAIRGATSLAAGRSCARNGNAPIATAQKAADADRPSSSGRDADADAIGGERARAAPQDRQDDGGGQAPRPFRRGDADRGVKSMRGQDRHDPFEERHEEDPRDAQRRREQEDDAERIAGHGRQNRKESMAPAAGCHRLPSSVIGLSAMSPTR